MLGLTALSLTPIPSPLASTSRPLSQHTHLNSSSSHFLKTLTLTLTPIPRKPHRFVLLANSNNGSNPEIKENDKQSDNDDDELRKNQRPLFGNIRWGDLLLDPDPNNILAVGLTGLLTWASVQVLWQLLFIALAILVAAVKYSFIAAVLLFILITLL